MYNKILVPLDGYKLAECVLPHVEALAKGCAVKEVIFARVFEPVRLPNVGEFVMTEQQAEQLNAEHKADSEKYLQEVLRKVRMDGVKIQPELLKDGPVAETLTEYANQKGVDLIVIATHGRSGVSRWVWGSVADRILRSSCVPVLMVRAPGCVPGI